MRGEGGAEGGRRGTTQGIVLEDSPAIHYEYFGADCVMFREKNIYIYWEGVRGLDCMLLSCMSTICLCRPPSSRTPVPIRTPFLSFVRRRRRLLFYDRGIMYGLLLFMRARVSVCMRECFFVLFFAWYKRLVKTSVTKVALRVVPAPLLFFPTQHASVGRHPAVGRHPGMEPRVFRE